MLPVASGYRPERLRRSKGLATMTEVEITPGPCPVSGRFPAGILRVDYRSEVDGLRDWALALPAADAAATWIVCIHGHGSTGDQLYTRADLRERMLPELRSRGYGILTPNLRGNAWMAPAAVTDLHELLAVVRRELGARAFVFASGSMGGSSNLIYAVRHPADVGGVVARGAATDLGSYFRWCRLHQVERPVLRQIADAIESNYGGGPDAVPELFRRHSALVNAGRLTMPVFLAHGTDDRTIPVSQARRLVGELSGSASLCYVEIPGGNHDSPLFVSTDPQPLDWIAARSRS